MQTFLPYANFNRSAAALDNKRLGKQRSEAKQILNALTNGGGWANHPAVRMWRGYESSLAMYGAAICIEWRNRGFRDTLLDWFWEQVRHLPACGPPPWLGREDLHASHRSNLLRKAPGHYGQFGWLEPPDLPYVWPHGFQWGPAGMRLGRIPSSCHGTQCTIAAPARFSRSR